MSNIKRNSLYLILAVFCLIAADVEGSDLREGFLATQAYRAGHSPVAMSIGDKHADASDIITADFKGHAVNVHSVSRSGISTIIKTISTRGRPSSVTTGDFNHDSLTDIAVLNYDEGTVTIYYGSGAGDYLEGLTIMTGEKPISIVAEDMDGKRPKDDLVVLSSWEDLVYIHYASGATKKITVGKGPLAFTIYDINGDGLKDIITANSGDNTVSVLIQNLEGEFIATDIIRTGPFPSSVAAGVFDSHGTVGLAVTSMPGGTVAIFVKSSAGVFQNTQTFPAGLSYPSKIVAGDFNRDGISDLAIAAAGASVSRRGSEIIICCGSKDGLFSYKSRLTAGVRSSALLTTDLTGDGVPDIIALNEISHNFIVYRSNGDGTFGYSKNYRAGDGAHWVIAEDLDLDGNMDLVTANIDSTHISVLIGNGDGSFRPPVKYDIHHNLVHAVTAGDVNGDGVPDLLIANLNSLAITILYGNGDGTFSFGAEYRVGPRPHLVRIADVNGDSIPDLVIPIYGSVFTTILFGRGDGSFASGPSLFSGVQPNDAAVADLNNDGIPDIVISHFEEDYITVFIGIGGGAFFPGINVIIGSGQHSILAADINHDGKIDIIGSTFFGNSVFTLFGEGNGSFSGLTKYQSGKLTSTIALEDFNGDGIAELATVCEMDNIITVFDGNSDGSFSLAADFIAGNRPAALTVGDFNNDGKSDIAVANWYSDNISIILRK